MESVAVYPGSFDPMTWGHVRVVEQVARVFGRVVVAVGVNPDKKCLFSMEERVILARRALRHVANVEVCGFEGLLARFLAENDYRVVIRGLRSGRDLEDNFLQELFAWSQREGVDVAPFYVPPRPGEAFISSSLLKMAMDGHGDVVSMAPLASIHAVQVKRLGQHLCGVTGPIGAGKTHVCKEFVRIGKERGLEVHHVDLDALVHEIYSTRHEPLYRKVRDEVAVQFGPEVMLADGAVDRVKLAKLVFGSPEAMARLWGLLQGALLVLLRQRLRELKGLVLVDGPTLVEVGWLSVVNNHMLVVAADEKTTGERLLARYGKGGGHVPQRRAAQFDGESKEAAVLAAIARDSYGGLVKLDNGGVGASEAALVEAFEAVLRQGEVFAADA